MAWRTHRIPLEMFDDLAAGRGAGRAVGLLAQVQYSKHVLLVRQVVESARAAGHEQAALARHGYDLLAEVQEHDRAAVDAVLRHPPVGAWARRTIQMLGDDQTRERAVPGQLASVAVAGAIRAGLDCAAEVPVTDGSVMLPSVGRADLPERERGDRARLRVTGGRADIINGDWSLRLPADLSSDVPGWHGLRGLSADAAGKRLEILIEDLDPWRMPGYINLGGRLSPLEAERWQSALDGAWAVLASQDQEVAAGVAAAIRAFTPLLLPASGSASATSKEAFGSIALSAPSDHWSLAVTLAHETQHAKFSALLEVVPMLQPDDGSRYYAPWRDDPRPLSGLLDGAYAFLAVAGLWRRQAGAPQAGGPDATTAYTEFARWRDAVRLVLGTLAASGRLTGPGRRFVDGMAGTVNGWAAEPVPAHAADVARRLAEEHRARWIRANGRPAKPVVV
jgi:HEXXH motif-containing protein